MKVNLVGIERVNYVKKDGTPVSGCSMYVNHEPSQRKAVSVVGLIAENIWVSDSNKHCIDILKSLPVPCDINLVYEFDGRFQYLVDILIVSNK